MVPNNRTINGVLVLFGKLVRNLFAHMVPNNRSISRRQGETQGKQSGGQGELQTPAQEPVDDRHSGQGQEAPEHTRQQAETQALGHYQPENVPPRPAVGLHDPELDKPFHDMGPIPRSDGVAFRVWAPHARKVALVGTFNAWNSSHHEMEREGNGYWYAKVPEAAKGHEYRYLLMTPTGKLWRIDPYARQVTDSNGNAVVHDPDFDWEGDNFRMPPWNELVVYEMHVGTFHVPHNWGDRPGTFATAAARLKHLVELGINAIEVMPVAEFEGSRSWGYNPSCLFAVETAYGGSRAFKAFVKECLSTASRSSSTSSTTTSVPILSTCGALTAGTTTISGASTSTTTAGRAPRGATPGQITAGRKFGGSCATTP